MDRTKSLLMAVYLWLSLLHSLNRVITLSHHIMPLLLYLGSYYLILAITVLLKILSPCLGFHCHIFTNYCLILVVIMPLCWPLSWMHLFDHKITFLYYHFACWNLVFLLLSMIMEHSFLSPTYVLELGNFVRSSHCGSAIFLLVYPMVYIASPLSMIPILS